jgi:hypothetical protein
MLIEIARWTLIGFGLFVLTEGYHAFRQRTEAAPRPLQYWWLAGLITALGLGLISAGLSIGGA